MAKDPAVLFYTNDFLSGTFTMTDEQVGKYIRLLCLQHQKGKLNEKDMYYICKTYDEDVFSKFVEEDGKFYNKRMLDEATRRKKYSESRKKNISKRYEKKSEPTYVEHMETETETINEDKIYSLFNRTYKKVPNPAEIRAVKKYYDEYGEDSTFRLLEGGALRGIKSISYLMSNIDSKGCLMSYEDKKNKEEIKELNK